jgi:hypothetical protein
MSMKKLIPFLILAAVFTVACNQRPGANIASQSQTQQAAVTADTTGLASFQLWKAQNELASVNQYNQSTAAVPAQEKQTIVYRTAPSSTSKKTTTKRSTSQSRPVSSSSGSGVSNDSGTGSSSSSGEAQAPVAKKGISKAAKGAIIGGVGGAIAGAVINKKNRVAGAVIGGVIGAGGGYAIGRGMDKKDGRVGSSGSTSTPPFSIPTGIFQK